MAIELKPYQLITGRLKKVRGRTQLIRENKGEFATLGEANAASDALDDAIFIEKRVRLVAWEVLRATQSRGVFLTKEGAEGARDESLDRVRAFGVETERFDQFAEAADDAGKVDMEKANELSRAVKQA